MGTQRHHDGGSRARSVSRRDLVRAGAGAAGLAALTPLLGPSRAAAQEGGSITFLSTQLQPVAEAEKMRNEILADFPGGEVEFVPEREGAFFDRLVAEAEAGQGTVGLAGGQHGDLVALAARGLLTDLSDLMGQLGDRQFTPEYLELARVGGQAPLYIPWMQATYVMAARREALDHLPEGVDEAALQAGISYDQLAAWVLAMNEAAGPRFGLPAGAEGLLPRFLQGYSYPSYTGALNTRFRSPEAVQMWQWLQGLEPATNPQFTNYNTMSEPLLSGEVWLAWDHTARLIEAVRTTPDQFVLFPAPRGPQGLGFLPVVAGLAIPRTSPNPELARSVIEYLTRPEVQALTLQQVAFFPPTTAEPPADLEPGIRAEADAVVATQRAEGALPSLLPVGLGEQSGAYNEVFRDTFQRIVIDGEDPATALEAQAANLQAVLDTAQAGCWRPDPVSDGVCQVS